ncbi:MAG: YHS domain protein [Lewinellaceae bacterium]|nr:YHS domain protein [Lewinellaceae bacterium]
MKSKLLFALFIISSFSAFAQRKVIYQTKRGAIDGYDPVAYFTEGRPVKGNPDIVYTWKGATWHFSSKAHRDLFAAKPEQYAPQYDGYCAYGWAQGDAVKIEGEAWKIIDAKLYLNYDLSIQKKWEKNIPDYIQKADKNWKSAQH